MLRVALVCERRGIRFDRMIDGALLRFMNPTDVYALYVDDCQTIPWQDVPQG